jgi:hypothetical protein
LSTRRRVSTCCLSSGWREAYRLLDHFDGLRAGCRARPDLMALHVTAAGAGGAPPIPAKKPFIFRDMRFLLRRSYLILRELDCRYLSTRELRVFRDGSGDAPGVRAFLTRPLILIVRQRRELICKLFLGDSREGGWGSRSLILVSMKLRQGWVTEGPAAHSSR